MNAATELLFLGLPETGKTTYFVALDEVLERQTEAHGLISAGFTANRSFIEKAKSLWREGKSVERTKLMTIDEPVELLVRRPGSEAAARLVAPDVNGEFFDAQWVDRKWPVSYHARLQSVEGIFLFVHAGQNARNEEISGAWRSIPSDPSVKKTLPWAARSAAKQVKLVELLQFISQLSDIRHPIPIAVLISAWDVIESRESSKYVPDAFLGNEWPLLHQYLQANPETCRYRAFGVSARGGDDQAQAQLAEVQPHERVWLKENEQVTTDLTRPLRWMLGWG